MTSTLRTYFTTLYRSIFSPPLYADVIRRWKGTGALYLLFLAMLVALIFSVRLSTTMMSVADDNLNHILNQVPIIEIKKGEMTLDVDRPYDITLKNGAILVRFVDQISLDEVKEENKDVPILLTPKEAVVIRPENDARAGEMRIHSLSNVDDMVIDRAFVKNLWEKGKWLAPLLVWPFTALGLWVAYFFQAAVVAVISYVVTAFMKEEYIFETRLRMSAIALTPIILVNQISQLILGHRLNFVMAASMATLYIFVMIKTSRQVD